MTDRKSNGEKLVKKEVATEVGSHVITSRFTRFVDASDNLSSSGQIICGIFFYHTHKHHLTNILDL